MYHVYNHKRHSKIQVAIYIYLNPPLLGFKSLACCLINVQNRNHHMNVCSLDFQKNNPKQLCKLTNSREVSDISDVQAQRGKGLDDG